MVTIERNLVKIPSYHGYEAIKADYVEREMERMGLEVGELILDAPDRRCILGTLRGTGSGKAILFTAHMDAFWPTPLQEEMAHKAEVKGDKIYGLGTGASYAPMTAAFGALDAIRRSGVKLRGDVMLLATVDELGWKSGAKLAAENGLKAEVCIMGQPTGLDIGILHTGKVEVEISTTAYAENVLLAYAERAGIKAANAVVSMHKIMTYLFQMQKEDPYFNQTHPLLPGKGAGLYIGPIIGGSTGYGDPTREAGAEDAKVRGLASPGPAWCRLRVGARYWPGQTAEGFVQTIERWVEKAKQDDPGIQVAVRKYMDHGNVPFEVSPDSPAVKTLQANIRQVQDREPKLIGNVMSTEGPFYAKAGMNVAWCAPGWLRFGSPEEHVTKQELLDTARIYAGCAIDVCS